MKPIMSSSQQGFALIEVMIAVLIFALGILGVVAMGGTAIASQSDARARTDAVALAGEMAGLIAINVNRNPHSNIAASLATFEHQTTGTTTGSTPCVFSGNASTNPLVTSWVAKVNATGAGLSGLPAAVEQIKMTPNAFNRIEVTVCWKSTTDTAYRHHTLVTYVD